jgi:hypothetical protein
MKRAGWMKDQISILSQSPLGTPQFSVSKRSNFPYNHESLISDIDELLLEESEKHFDSLIPAKDKESNLFDEDEYHNNQSYSDPMKNIFAIRALYEDSIAKIRKKYLQHERKLFRQIQNEEELQLLIATRPGILEMPARVSVSPLIPDTKALEENRYAPSNSFSKHLKDLSQSTALESFPNPNLKQQKLHFGSSENSAREKDVRNRFSAYFSQKKLELIKQHEDQLSSVLEETEKVLENYWTGAISDLQERLQESQAKIEPTSDEINLEKQHKFKLTEIKSQLEEEIESKYKAHYIQQRSKHKNPQITKKDLEKKIMKLQAEIEIQQANQLNKEKEYWKKDLIKDVQELCRQKLKSEQTQVLSKKENELRRQVNLEKEEVVSRLIHDSLEAVDLKIQAIASEKEKNDAEALEILKDKCILELREETEAKFREDTRLRMKNSFEKDLRKNITNRIEMELKIRLEDRIYQEFNLEFEFQHENFRKKIENELNSKIKSLEDQFEDNRSSEIASTVEKKFLKIEKDLKINYLKKLDKLKLDTRNEFEEIYTGQVKVIHK